MAAAKKTLYKKDQSYKYDRKKSSADQLANQWGKLDKEQQLAAMIAMKKAGIPTRKVGALKTEGTISEGTQVAGSYRSKTLTQVPPHIVEAYRLKALKQVSPHLLVAPTPESKLSVKYE